MNDKLMKRFLEDCHVAIHCPTLENALTLFREVKKLNPDIKTKENEIQKYWNKHKDLTCFYLNSNMFCYSNFSDYAQYEDVEIFWFSVLGIDNCEGKEKEKKTFYIHTTDAGYFLSLSDNEEKLLAWFQRHLAQTDFYYEEITDKKIIKF